MTKNGRILLVEDDEDFGRSLALILKHKGFLPQWVASGEQALEVLTGKQFDVVITDMLMPGMNGLEFLRKYREIHGGDTPVVMITGYGSVNEAVEAMKAGAFGYFLKPVNQDEICLTIEKALEMGKTGAVPRVEGDDMVYYEIKDFSTLKSGYFGIMEPDGGKVCTREEGFLLVPGVAFDPARHRVGYGKGFYDRFLAAHPGFTTVAAAFEFQLFDAVPFEETDILPQMLVTEQKIYR